MVKAGFKQTEIGEIPEGWKIAPLGNIADFKNGKSSPDRNGLCDYEVFGSNGIIGNADQYNSPEETVVIGRVGSYCGSVYFSKNKCWVTDNAIIGLPKDDADARFLFYLLLNSHLNNHRTGSGQPLLNQGILNSIEVSVPPCDEQRAIAKILSDLDEKIELNHQMNKTLESIGQALFKRWFVEFEFPGCEKTKFVDGAPLGWEEIPLTEVVDVLGGGTPSTMEPSYWGTGLPFFTPKDVSDNCYVIETEKGVTLKGLGNCNSQKYPRNTVFITARGTVGKVCMAGCDMAMNQSCYAIRGKSNSSQQYYVYLLIKSLANQLTQNAHGTVFETITTDTFRKTQVIQPPQNVLDAFITRVEPFYDLILSNIHETRKLTQIRDSLLPRLMSGKIRGRL